MGNYNDTMNLDICLCLSGLNNSVYKTGFSEFHLKQGQEDTVIFIDW